MRVADRSQDPTALLSSSRSCALSPSFHQMQMCSQNSKNVSKGSSVYFPSSQNLVLHTLAISSHRLWTLMLCLFLLNLEITGGEPQALGNESSISAAKLTVVPPEDPSSTAYIHQGRRSIDSKIDSESEDGDGDITVFQHRLMTTMEPHLMGSPTFHSSRSNNTPENTEPVIASSFRNFESSQPTTDSNEEKNPVETTQDQKGSLKRKAHARSCDMALKKCLEGLPPMNDTGIPSTSKAVTTACSFYNTGIKCFDNWAETCLVESLRQKVKTSIIGAHEMYSFLCRDPKFRADYLKHKDCYKKLSPYWDNCSRQFIDGMRRNTKHNYTAFCCIRMEFLTCVSKSSSYFCSLEATTFLMKMAETLIRTSIRTAKSQTTDYCARVQRHHCVPIVESMAVATKNHFSVIPLTTIYIFVTCILPVTCGLLRPHRL